LNERELSAARCVTGFLLAICLVLGGFPGIVPCRATAQEQEPAQEPGQEEDAAALVKRGVEKAKAGEFEQALDLLTRALEFLPEQPEVHFNIGVVLENLDRVEESIPHYEEAIRLKPDLPGAYNNLGNAFWKTGNIDKAEEMFREALVVNPDYDLARINLGNVLLARESPRMPWQFSERSRKKTLILRRFIILRGVLSPCSAATSRLSMPMKKPCRWIPKCMKPFFTWGWHGGFSVTAKRK